MKENAITKIAALCCGVGILIGAITLARFAPEKIKADDRVAAAIDRLTDEITRQGSYKESSLPLVEVHQKDISSYPSNR